MGFNSAFKGLTYPSTITTTVHSVCVFGIPIMSASPSEPALLNETILCTEQCHQFALYNRILFKRV